MESRNVLVTGGSSGIGRALVERFASSGDRVWFTYHSGRERADALASALRGNGADVTPYAFDQGDPDSHRRLLDGLPGTVDVLVNNAGLGTATVGSYAPDSRQQQDLALLRVDAAGPLWLAEALVPGMLDRGYGKIVNIASVGGGIAVFPSFRLADGMGKAAVAHLTRQLAAQLVHAPVDVYAVCPGAVDTPMFRASTLDPLPPSRRPALVARLPKRRLIQPAEIADVVWWLCGDGGRVLHGAVIDASMGLGVHPGLLTGVAGGDTAP